MTDNYDNLEGGHGGPHDGGAAPSQRSPAARSVFEDYEPRDVRLLIESHPLAWVCSTDGGEASLLPLIGVFDADDRLVELIGHFGRSNPLAAAFAREPRATILFTGPHRYLSPSQAGRRDWGPTWNYAQARVHAEISVEPDFTPEAVARLVEFIEADREKPWRAAELGERYDVLIRHIVGFRARVTAVRGRFKLGQDEDTRTLGTLLGNLEDEGLARWMRRFNRDRLGDGDPSDGG